RTGGTHHRGQVTLGEDLVAIEGQDHVADPDARLFGGAARLDPGDQGADRAIQAQRIGKGTRDLLHLYADQSATHTAIGLQLLYDVLGDVDGDGEADAHVAARTGEDLRIDADHLAGQVEQRASGVAGIDGHVGLDEGHILLVTADAAAGGADHTGGHRVVEAEGRSDGNDPLSRLDRPGITQTHGG